MGNRFIERPYEENNVHGIEDITKNPCWERIINAANKEIARRKKEEWVEIDLKT